MKNLLKSLSVFQNECPPVKKESENPFFKSNYASLDAIQHHIKKHLSLNDLLIVQASVMNGDSPYVETTLFHVPSGEKLTSTFPVVVSKQTAQEYGSAVSYAKRYSLSGLLNLIIEDEDDDGEKATASSREQKNEKLWLNEGTPQFESAKRFILDGGSVDTIKTKYNVSKKVADLLTK
jgi:hypothetical protein